MGSLDITGADRYFRDGEHPASGLWNEADTGEREAAITYAKAQLERMKGTTLDTPSATANNDDVREDEALYELALHVLTTNPYRANAENTALTWDLTGADGEVVDPREAMDMIPGRVIRRMGWNRVEIVRA